MQKKALGMGERAISKCNTLRSATLLIILGNIKHYLPQNELQLICHNPHLRCLNASLSLLLLQCNIYFNASTLYENVTVYKE